METRPTDDPIPLRLTVAAMILETVARQRFTPKLFRIEVFPQEPHKIVAERLLTSMRTSLDGLPRTAIAKEGGLGKRLGDRQRANPEGRLTQEAQIPLDAEDDVLTGRRLKTDSWNGAQKNNTRRGRRSGGCR